MPIPSTLAPGPALLCKLASLAVHIDELYSSGGHEFDRAAINSLINDREVQTWIEEMGKMGMAPVKRAEDKNAKWPH